MFSIDKFKKNKRNYILIGAILLTILLAIYVFTQYYKKGTTNEIETFISGDKKYEFDELNTIWDNGSGFYSQLLFKLNHYIYCKKYNHAFKMSHHNWPYTYEKGWIDYFEPIELNSNRNSGNSKILDLGGCCTILEQFPLRDYVSIIPEFYRYNKKTEQHINSIVNKLGLIEGQYGAIYIRRGDKLVDEIEFIPSSKFLDLLLSKYPTCSTVFVQTDDYNSFIEIEKYVKDNGLNIKALTLCPPTSFGSIANNNYVKRMNANDISTLKEGSRDLAENKNYLKTIKNKNKSKPISEMNQQERYDHVMELLTSVEICIKSKICVCDYKSNVSRFIKIAHQNFNNVYDIADTDSTITIDTKKCPGFDFDSKHNM
jgi:hypothetical protein